MLDYLPTSWHLWPANNKFGGTIEKFHYYVQTGLKNVSVETLSCLERHKVTTVSDILWIKISLRVHEENATVHQLVKRYIGPQIHIEFVQDNPQIKAIWGLSFFK